MEKNIWYAYQETAEELADRPWDGEGTTDRHTACEWLREQYRNGNTAAEVDVIDSDDAFCIETITTDDVVE